MTTTLPSIEIGRNTTCVSIGALDIYFSYKTPVAFRAPGKGLVVSENCWGPTTGRHLNEIDGGSDDRKKARVKREEFEKQLLTLTHQASIAIGGDRY